MKKLKLITVVIALSLGYYSCEREPVNFDFSSPQEVEKVSTTLKNNDDLIAHFGENHIHFGPVPPSLNGLSFKVTGMDFDYCERYIFGPNEGDPDILSHADPPTYEASINHHHFFDQVQGISKHKLMTFGTHGDTYTKENDTVYIIGSGNDFTAYYIEKTNEEGSGNPTNAILISGTLEYDQQGKILGVKNYRIGKKILDYEYRPTINAYAKGTIEIKSHTALSPCYEWDTIQ